MDGFSFSHGEQFSECRPTFGTEVGQHRKMGSLLLKAVKQPDFEVHRNQEQRHGLCERWQRRVARCMAC